MAAELARRDVVFLGEDHDNIVGHRLQLEIIQSLHKLRPRPRHLDGTIRT
jgi:uncharacterized iron-regulated protein